ncbi:hypothetical protein [Micromonospora endophytica]|uniref:Uncharacterized protein n=1 Tax=Micromonospora endophytica TaxID=515350 RepID=A0A2W2CYD5_9ACTN|nr:hypothetical protein [Micromonospora endophytica]PZF98384.1 hypothetical protein C1I93_09055 [Micromonospora endophytica]RIW47687.1 hypothetical protein D3H59_09245 [Micromonospora endophytica]BCJ59365.1 hypothetical protein Jiend_27870 [Micromonospora endophytica]
MQSHLALLIPVAAVWWVAGYLADGLPRMAHARGLRRHAGWLLALTLAGLSLTVALPIAGLATAGATVADRAAGGLALAAVPALVVAVCTVRRLRRLRAGAVALAVAPRTPAPHGLRAAAAHPLIGLPLQVTGLALVPAVIAASGAGQLLGPGAAGPAVTVGALGVAAIGVRHALRHNRLAERAMPQRATASARSAGALHV